MKTLFLLGLFSAFLFVSSASAEEAEFVSVSKLDADALRVENGASVSTNDQGLRLSFPASKSYPGVDLVPAEGRWDLAAFGGVAVDVTNESPVKVGVSVRVENPGDWKTNPWNAQVLWLAPGASGTVKVMFGESFGKSGFALDASDVNKIKIFVNPTTEEGNVVIEKISGIEAK